MPHKDLIPGADPDYDKFMTAFYQAISAGLLKWKIPQTEVDPSTPLLISWKNSYGACQIKKSASSVDIDLKNADKAVLTAFTRPFIQKWVYLNSNMTDNDIQKCGLKPHSKDRKHAGKPDSIPAIALKNTPGFSITGTYRQSTGDAGTSGRGKPAGVGSFQIAMFIGAVPPADPKNYTRTEIFTKTPYRIVFDPAQAGQTVWFIARWISTDHIPGDWSKPVSMTIY